MLITPKQSGRQRERADCTSHNYLFHFLPHRLEGIWETRTRGG
jgi:hypothetical protein